MNNIKDFISLMYSLLEKWKRIRDISLWFCISDGIIKEDNAQDNTEDNMQDNTEDSV